MNDIFQIFKHLNDSNIRYCHFKSNAHLSKSFSGKTDFDLLVDRDHCHGLQRFLFETGFKRRDSTFDKQYTGMEDYLYYDTETESLHHFHIHYNLIFGAKYRKVFTYPDTDFLLKNTVHHSNYPLRILRPEMELIFLFFRILLKTNLFSISRLKNAIRKRDYLPHNILSELDYLIPLCDFGLLNTIVEEHFVNFSAPIFNFINRYQNKILDTKYLIYLKWRLLPSIKKFQAVSDKKKRYDFRLRQKHRKHSRSWLTKGGLIIGIIGADGAGKSTIVEDIKKWLSYKISVKNSYLGRPKNDLKLYTLRLFSRGFRKFRLLSLHKLFHGLGDIYVAYRRRCSYRRARYDAAEGYIVLADRFPLKEFWQMEAPMDGPRIKSDSKTLRRIERYFYRKIDDYPDILMVLKILLKDSLARKSQHNDPKVKESIEKKIQAVNSLHGNLNHKGCFFIDASQPFETVIKEIKEIIWQSI